MELNVINKGERETMKSSKDYVQWDLENQRKLCAEYRKSLKRLPDGGMFMSNHDNKKYYYDAETHDYIGKVGSEEVVGRQQHYFLKKSISVMEDNIKAADKYLKKFKDYMPEDVMSSLPAAYRFSDLEGLPEVISFADFMKSESSMNQAKEAGLVRSEGKEYVMKDGDIVLFKFNV